MKRRSKSVGRLLRKWRMEAHERELHRELARLEERFAQWRDGAISSGELSARIHEWDRGPSRALYKHYNDSSADLCVGYAIAAGILDAEEVEEELLEAITGPLAFFRSIQGRGELRTREGAWWRD